jgi:predicted aspartyl protease
LRAGLLSCVCATCAIGVALGSLSASEPKPKRIVLPMELSSGRPSIGARINGHGPYPFLLDTGSGAGLILDQALATQLGLASSGTRRIGDPNSPEAIEARVMKVDRVDLGSLALRDVDAISWNRQAMGKAGSPEGVVGLDLFGARLVTLDYPGGTLIVEPGELPEADGRTILDASFDDGIPSLSIDVAGVTLRAHLDSGSTGFLGLPLATAKRLPLEAPPVRVGRGRTASGDYAVSEARLRGTVRVGGLVIDRPMLHFMDLPSGNLGSDLLRSLVVTVDRKNARVRLVPSGKPLEPTERPRRRAPPAGDR